ncbi:MAG: hypothetical protein KAT69_09570, partial [Candidatus Aminicenantes bacterium]|nr:hypothetical protein [Candidatus Aminicenantes bacterium]
MNEFEKLVLDKIKEEMAKKKLSNRKLVKLLKGDNFKEGRDDVWIGQKLSGNRKLRIDEFGQICEKLKINPGFIFLSELNPIFMKTSVETVFKTLAKLI